MASPPLQALALHGLIGMLGFAYIVIARNNEQRHIDIGYDFGTE